MRELNVQEVEQVSGGIGPLVIPAIVIPGAVVAGGILAVGIGVGLGTSYLANR